MNNLSIIVAIDQDGGFGKKGKIPWNIKEDMKHFQETTRNSVCVMGRRTYQDMLEMWINRKSNSESKKTELTLPSNILPNRESFVLSRDKNLHCPGATRVDDLRAVLDRQSSNNKPIFILGGLKLWIEAFAYNPTVYMTVIDGDPYDCDLFFPLDILNKRYKLQEGRQGKQCKFLTYIPIKGK